MGSKLLLYVLIGVLILSGFTGCADRQFTYSRVYLLSASDLQKRKHEALNGNAQAAFDVYLHYKMGRREHESRETLYWLKKAVALGHPVARQHFEAWEERRSAER